MPAMTREERANLDKQRKQLDGAGEEIRSHVPSREYRRNYDRIFRQRQDAETEERDDG